MNLFDLILLLLLFGSCIRGYQRGLVLQITSLFGMIIGIWLAFHFTNDLAPVLSKYVPLPKTVHSGWLSLVPVEKFLYSGLAFILILICSKFLLSIGAGIVNQVAQFPVISLFNRSGGLVFALLQTLLFFVVLVNVLHILPWQAGQEAVNGSLLSKGLLAVTPDLTQGLKELFKGKTM